MSIEVIRKYIPPAGSTSAPGVHYTLRETVPDRRVAPDAYRHYSFYRTSAGSEVACEIGYGTGPEYRVACDGNLFRRLQAAVESYDSQAPA